ncbi:G5 domain-containing protein [Actinoplanes sp. NPDC051513]|uniref:G5 domain-containing protein n=1 Tax=Actinoplanes sp. NPDC051513 TaxID=3363908 RepID=UPI0037B5A88F
MPRKSWWARLPFGVRMAAGASAVLAVIAGGVVGIATLTGGHGGEGPRIVTEVGQAAPATREVPEAAEPAAEKPRAQRRFSTPSDRTAAKSPKNAAPAAPVASSPAVVAPVTQPPAPTEPVRTTRTEVETREIPYETRLVRDPALPRGSTRVETPGVKGVETLRYLVTLADGRPAGRSLIDAVVTRQPQHRVIALGTQHPAAKKNCGEALNFCVPLGRKAICPGKGREEDASIPLPDMVLNAADLEYLEGLAC